MLSKDNVINLEDFRVSGSKVFTGRDRGASVRKRSKIDELIDRYPSVVVVIPDNLYSINPSFFEELFVNVVERLGREEFFRRFEFRNEGSYNYLRRLEEAVDSILRTKTAID